MMMTADTCQFLRDPTVADMDPLGAAAFHNLSCGPLCRLPESLLVNIMSRLGLLGIRCLRRACRLLLCLYTSPKLCHIYVTHRNPISFLHC
jgi:hypothetical protein